MIVSRRGYFAFFVIAMLLALSSVSAVAQSSSSGTVSGEVTDQQGAVMPGVEVTLTEPSTNISLKTVTNDAGRYIIVNVSPGSYNVTFSKTGFSTRKVNKQAVNVAETLNVNAVLEVGQVSNVVEVTTAPGAELQTINATVGTTVSGDSLIYLPIFGSDASSLAIYQPGVSPEGAVAGAMYDQNTFQLDGGNNSNDMDGSMRDYTGSYARGAFAGNNTPPSGVLPTPPDTIEEFKVGTAGQTADFNGSSGAQISVVTKRGTNQFHGTGYYYYSSSDVGGANTWDNNHTPSGNLGYTPIPITHNNRYGFTLGGPILPKIAGGKTYFFFGYEGFKFPQSSLVDREVPTATLRAGVIQIDEGGTYVPYNINPYPVTVNGTTYQPAMCGGGTACDPRGIGLNSIVSQLWTKYMPLPNNFNVGDAYNVSGYQGQASLPEKTAFLVGRIDHDFGPKWRMFGSYRYYGLSQLTTNQTDIGGALPGDTFGQVDARAPRPQKPDMLVGGLTTNITPTMTNSFTYSFTRIWWQWASSAAPPQLPGLGGALEIGGETSQALIPYNVNNQNTRQRFWDGHDSQYKDDVTKIVGNHVIQFGGLFGRNFDYHERNDNGQGINTSPVYQVGSGTGINYTAVDQPANLPSSQISKWNTYYSEILGIVNQPQQLFTRSGPNLSLNPPLTPMFDKSGIDFYNLYITDSWHISPTVTLTYGLGYQVEMPPVEQSGKQVELVNTNGNPINFTNYFATKAAQAEQGQVYNPEIGFATIANVVGASHKYPYNPFYGGVSPRAAIAWNPKGSGMLGKLTGEGKTVIRAGYGQIYSRLNGVGLVLIPLLGVGLGQPVSCIGASSSGQCLGTAGVTPASAFRIGTDGLTAPIPTPSTTLPQPFFPGIGSNVAAGAASVLDPSFRPAATYNYNVSIQRELRPRMLFEVGYIGRVITHEWMQRDLDAVPTMMTLNGQSYAQAFAGMYINSCGLSPTCTGNLNVPVQPFIEAALGGANSSFCSGYGSCTAAVMHNPTMYNYMSLTQNFSLWSALSQASSWTLGRTIPSSQSAAIPSGQASGIFADDSSGSSNYNALYTTFKTQDWHGVTTLSNFTWGRALGTGNQSQATSEYTVVNPYNVRQSMYGPQFYDYKFTYTQTFLWSEPFFKGQRGVLGAALGGWRIAPIVTAISGAPLAVGTLSNNDSFGETQDGGTLDGAVLAAPYTGGNTVHYNQNVANSATGAGVNSNSANGGNNMNMFSNPAAVFNEFRPCILGYDTSCGSSGQIRGLSNWNMDMNVAKDFRLFRERVYTTLSFQFNNVFNHVTQNNPYLSIGDPGDWGVTGSNNANGAGGQSNLPRQLTFSLRFKF
jgi:hypothetical protein